MIVNFQSTIIIKHLIIIVEKCSWSALMFIIQQFIFCFFHACLLGFFVLEAACGKRCRPVAVLPPNRVVLPHGHGGSRPGVGFRTSGDWISLIKCRNTVNYWLRNIARIAGEALTVLTTLLPIIPLLETSPGTRGSWSCPEGEHLEGPCEVFHSPNVIITLLISVS